MVKKKKAQGKRNTSKKAKTNTATASKTSVQKRKAAKRKLQLSDRNDEGDEMFQDLINSMNNIKSLLSYLWTYDSDDALEDHVPGKAGDVSETKEWMSNHTLVIGNLHHLEVNLIYQQTSWRALRSLCGPAKYLRDHWLIREVDTDCCKGITCRDIISLPH